MWLWIGKTFSWFSGLNTENVRTRRAVQVFPPAAQKLGALLDQCHGYQLIRSQSDSQLMLGGPINIYLRPLLISSQAQYTSGDEKTLRVGPRRGT